MEIELKRLSSKNLVDFMTWAGDKAVTEALFWDAYSSEQEASEYLREVVEPHPWYKAIVFAEKIVGAVTLDQGKGKDKLKAELGYVLGKDYWGKGIATRAVQIALADGFADLRIKRIEAFVDPENIASIRVLEKSGMIREAYLKKYLIHRNRERDRYVYAKTID